MKRNLWIKEKTKLETDVKVDQNDETVTDGKYFWVLPLLFSIWELYCCLLKVIYLIFDGWYDLLVLVHWKI